ncbi:hypothetical protein [Staphylococcus saprophyticus]|uniref:hypothetical protein n=1 Tax=Staphylococcus saprophyticus TaxID=29385 RepID=UPI00119E3B78|nr:hypothetical protein [Staphylococcus saprophyticus]
MDGDILKYYDKRVEMNMDRDKKRRYRLLCNGGNLMGLWDVEEGIGRGDDLNMGYGFREKDIVDHCKKE